MGKLNTKSKLQKYIPLVDFLEAILGKNSEIVLHDLENPDHSVIAIRNNYISNREVGAPATDLVLRILKESHKEERDFIANYRGIGKFNKALKSSTYFIREEGELIGMICVNTDEAIFDGLFSSMKKLQENFIKEEVSPSTENVDSENLSLSIEEVAHEAISDVLSTQNVSIEYLKQQDKLNIIEVLYLKGIFLLKGAVVEIAKALGMSEASVYRYVQIIKRQEQEENKGKKGKR
ncbi:MAG: PAS domain-containing protein [Leptotrichiaceae bacterium]|nr:PAS domain-containing protein [Leptotrichiaceae bacterium]